MGARRQLNPLGFFENYVSENLTFDRAGLVVAAEVFHGVTRQP